MDGGIVWLPDIAPWAQTALAAGYAVCMAAWAAMEWPNLSRYWRLRRLFRRTWAPVFMIQWLGFAVLGLYAFDWMAPSAKPWFVLALQVDFACIMITAGTAKLRGGYFEGRGMDLALRNPMWSRYPWLWSGADPRSRWMRAANHAAWSVEIAAGLAMLVPVPAVKLTAALVVAGSFLALFTQFRVGMLLPMVALSCLIFWPA